MIDHQHLRCSLMTQWQRILLQCRRPRFDPWVRKVPWRRTWQPTLGFWIPGIEEPGGLQSTGSQWVEHDWSEGACRRTHIHTLGSKLVPWNLLQNEVSGTIKKFSVYKSKASEPGAIRKKAISTGYSSCHFLLLLQQIFNSNTENSAEYLAKTRVLSVTSDLPGSIWH